MCLQDIEKLLGALRSFYSQIIIKTMRKPFEISAFMLREVVKWRCNVDSGILRNSAVVRTEGDGSASKTCRERAISIFKRGLAGARSVTQIGTM
jgi:hypothetical protein